MHKSKTSSSGGEQEGDKVRGEAGALARGVGEVGIMGPRADDEASDSPGIEEDHISLRVSVRKTD